MIKRIHRNNPLLVKGYGIRRIRRGYGIKEVLTSIFNPVMKGINYLMKNKETVKQVMDTAGSAITIGQNAKRVVDEIRKKGVNKEVIMSAAQDPAITDLINKIKAIKVGHGFAYI